MAVLRQQLCTPDSSPLSSENTWGSKASRVSIPPAATEPQAPGLCTASRAKSRLSAGRLQDKQLSTVLAL